jgi:RNA polymerase sigma factor (sigma-70 family)
MSRLLAALRRLASADAGRSVGGPTDGDLLDRFLERRDEAAFAEIVRRHGPMVWAVCRRVLRADADAEDAFQAAFLTLARRAASVSPRSAVGNWLYGVANRTARKALATKARRRERERTGNSAAVNEEPAPPTPDLETAAVIDEELNRLPDKYRLAVVLCELERLTLREAAARLGWPQGTVASRLARGRQRLAAQLARRGITAPVVGVTALLTTAVPAPAVSERLAGIAVRAALAYAATQPLAGIVSEWVVELTDQAAVSASWRRAVIVVVGLLATVAGVVLVLSTPAVDRPRVPPPDDPGVVRRPSLNRVEITPEFAGPLVVFEFRTEEIAAELNLTREQRTAVDEQVRAVQSRLTADYTRLTQPIVEPGTVIADANPVEVARQLEPLKRELATAAWQQLATRTLSPAQVRRMVQIDLQKNFPDALLRPALVRALGLTPAQGEQVREIIDQFHREGHAAVAPPGEATPPKTPPGFRLDNLARDLIPRQVYDRAEARLRGLLTADQQRVFSELLGEPFRPAKLTPLVGGPLPPALPGPGR